MSSRDVGIALSALTKATIYELLCFFSTLFLSCSAASWEAYLIEMLAIENCLASGTGNAKESYSRFVFNRKF